jgi:hypothetical protein
MNYGYECKGWTKQQKQKLAADLQGVIDIMEITLEDLKKEGGASCDFPYIEIDGLYDGVRIRKITYLNDDQRKHLVITSDACYAHIDNEIVCEE